MYQKITVKRHLSYTCVKCQESSISHVKYVGRYRDSLVIHVQIGSTTVTHVPYVRRYKNPKLCFCQMPELLSYICAICRQIKRISCYTCAKCQHSSVTHVTNVTRYNVEVVLLVPNVRTTQLHVCDMPTDTKKF